MRLLAAFLTVAVAQAAAPEYGYQVVHVYPHDRTAFTEGLEFRGGFLYESTGLEGRSTLQQDQARNRAGGAADPAWIPRFSAKGSR